MKYVKKIACLLLVLVMVAGSSTIAFAGEEGDPAITLQVDKTEVQVGEEVTVTIGTDKTISDIFAIGMDLIVDHEVFEYVSSTPAEGFSEVNQIGVKVGDKVRDRLNIAKIDLSKGKMTVPETITTVVLRAKKSTKTTNIRIENLEATRADTPDEKMKVTVNAPKAVAVIVNEKPEPEKPTQPAKPTQPQKPAQPAKPVKVSKIKITGMSGKIAAGKKIQLRASVSPANAANKGVTWKSSNTKVATVNSKGLVTVKKKTGGKSVKIYAVAKDGSGVKGYYTIKSMKGVVKSVKISGKKSVKAGKTLKLKASVSATKGANKTLIWKSSNTKYAMVKNGKVTTKRAGRGKKVTITAMATDGSNKKKSVKITIKK